MSGSDTMSYTECFGFRDSYGSWNTIWRIFRSFRILSASIPLLDRQYRMPQLAVAYAEAIATRTSTTRTNRPDARPAPNWPRVASRAGESEWASLQTLTPTIDPRMEAGSAKPETIRGTAELGLPGGRGATRPSTTPVRT